MSAMEKKKNDEIALQNLIKVNSVSESDDLKQTGDFK